MKSKTMWLWILLCGTVWAGEPIPRLTGIIPMVECNRDRHLEPTVAGLEHWLRTTNTAIVTTVPGNPGLYETLQERVPRMQIIPGIKTNDFLTEDFASPEAWAKVRVEVTAALTETGENRIFLMNESAVRPIWKGTQPFDVERFRESIRRAGFPQEVIYYWYPSVGAWRKDQQTRAAEVCRAVQDCFENLVFIDSASLSGPTALTWEANMRVAAILREFIRNKPVPLLQCHNNYWPDDRLPEALGYAVFRDEGAALLYPGQGRWVEASQSISDVLIKAGLVKRPYE